MGLFKKMDFEEAFAVLSSENPSKSDLKKAHKVIDALPTGDKRTLPCFLLLNLHGEIFGTQDAAYRNLRVAENFDGISDELRRVLDLPFVFNSFKKGFETTGRLSSGLYTVRAYENGWGVDRDHAKAVEIAKNFINTPESDPLYEHVQELLAGIGVEREPVSAKEPVRFDEAPPYAGANKHHIEYENGDVYDGEMKDGKRHGKGRLATKFGDIYEGEFQNDKFHGHGIFKELSADEENYWCCEGEWVNGKKEGRFKCWGIVIEDGSEDRFEDEFYKNGEQIETEPAKAEPTVHAPASEPDDETEEQNSIGSLSELKDLYRDPDLFEDPRDKYIENSCYYIEPYVLAVVDAFDSGDERKAARLLADILETEPGRTYEYAHGDGEGNGYNFIFRALLWASEAVDDSVAPILVNLCYYLWETSDHDGDYFDPVIDLYARQDALSKDEWWFVTLISRLRENGDTETPVSDDDPKNVNSPVFESEYGEELDDFLADGWLPSANGGMYLPDSAAEEYEENDQGFKEPVSYTTRDGDDYIGYLNEDGQCHGWGEIKYVEGGNYRGFFKNGVREGFGVEQSDDGFYCGNYQNGLPNGQGVFIVKAPNSKTCPTKGTYFEDSVNTFNPLFFDYKRSGDDVSFGKMGENQYYIGIVDGNQLSGWAQVWSVEGERFFFEEGVFHGHLFKQGIRVMRYNEDQLAYYRGFFEANGDMFSYDVKQISDIWKCASIYINEPSNDIIYNEGCFDHNKLNGMGFRIHNGWYIFGDYEDDTPIKVDRIIRPDGTEGTVQEYREYLEKKNNKG